MDQSPAKNDADMQARVDVLTGLPTFFALPSALDEAMPAIFLDIDGFRWVNHQLGHLVGDDVLKRLGAWLAQQAEMLQGQVFRVAGDEFILLLRGRTLDETAAIANGIIAGCPSLRLPYASPAESRAAITLSAVVFSADSKLPGRLRTTLDEFAEALYRTELELGRTHSNIVISDVSLKD